MTIKIFEKTVSLRNITGHRVKIERIMTISSQKGVFLFISNNSKGKSYKAKVIS